MKPDRAITIGLQGDKDVNLNIQGQISLEEALDMLNTALYELLQTFEKHANDQKKLTNHQRKQLKEDIYRRAVWGFSLMIDKYHPNAKKGRFQGLTEEAIMKAQDEILSSKQEKT